jgi:predicted XRE-type DNA-binding protein
MNKHIGSNFDDFLEEEGTLTETEAIAIKRVVSYQITQFMEQKGLSKSAMARQMDTSRSALDRLLDPKNTAITLHTLERAAQAIGKRLHIEFA